jgi:DNA-binding response OmpR family regulator
MAILLLVDDHPLVRLGLAETLRRAGHSVTDVGDGRTAIVLLQSQPFDLLITDLGLPEVDGIAVIGAARALSSQPKIIAMSAATPAISPSGPLMPVAHDADLFFAKPFSGGTLLAAVERLLGTNPMTDDQDEPS